MDILRKIGETLIAVPALKGVVVKPFERPESVKAQDPSVVIVPMKPPTQTTYGSNIPLRKRFTYQIEVEAATYLKAIELGLAVEKAMLGLGFYQLDEGMESYFGETRRYVDVRRYRGYSELYDTEY